MGSADCESVHQGGWKKRSNPTMQLTPPKLARNARPVKHRLLQPITAALAMLALLHSFASTTHAGPSYSRVIQDVQPKIVKIYGAGGFRGLEAYQSGFLVRVGEEVVVLTVWSYVLDTEFITVHLDDGRRFEAEMWGADPRKEVAVLKIDAEDPPAFDLDRAADGKTGGRVLAFSNLYGVATGDEPASVQHGVIAVQTHLQARRGVFETPYKGNVYILDAVTNNPGAAGGALTDRQGQLIGMLGKELRNASSNTWLNYAIPISELRETVGQIVSGEFIPPDMREEVIPKAEKPMNLDMLGIVLVPDVLERTPPFVDEVRIGSPAAAAGMRPDDLILFVNDHRLIQSCKALTEELQFIDRDDPIKLTVIRGQELVEFELSAR